MKGAEKDARMSIGKLLYTIEDLERLLDEDPVAIRDALVAANVRMVRGGADADLSGWFPRVQSQPDGSSVLFDIELVPGPHEVVVLSDSLPESWRRKLGCAQSAACAEPDSNEDRRAEAEEAVRRNGGNKTHAAKDLNISTKELRRRLGVDGTKAKSSDSGDKVNAMYQPLVRQKSR